ncbi:25340_t:CDS:2, partial [Dentiscutata erythropus]
VNIAKIVDPIMRCIADLKSDFQAKFIKFHYDHKDSTNNYSTTNISLTNNSTKRIKSIKSVFKGDDDDDWQSIEFEKAQDQKRYDSAITAGKLLDFLLTFQLPDEAKERMNNKLNSSNTKLNSLINQNQSQTNGTSEINERNFTNDTNERNVKDLNKQVPAKPNRRSSNQYCKNKRRHKGNTRIGHYANTCPNKGSHITNQQSNRQRRSTRFKQRNINSNKDKVIIES